LRDITEGLRVTPSDGEKGPSSAAGLLPSLFPTLKGANRDAKQLCEVHLGQPGLLPRGE